MAEGGCPYGLHDQCLGCLCRYGIGWRSVFRDCAIRLANGGGMSRIEVAEAIGSTEATVWGVERRAIRKMRRALEALDDGQ